MAIAFRHGHCRSFAPRVRLIAHFTDGMVQKRLDRVLEQPECEDGLLRLQAAVLDPRAQPPAAYQDSLITAGLADF
jgi:hypothetical protein